MTTPSPVRHTPPHRPWAMGLVLCVLVLGMLAPAVSRALAWARSTTAVEICSATGGAQWVRLPTTSTVPEASSAPVALPSLDHCPLCLQATDRGTAPLPSLPAFFWGAGDTRTVPVWQARAFPSPTFSAASARGPPAQG